MFVPGYRHFLRTADSLKWDEAAVELGPDAATWDSVPASLRGRIAGLVAGFCVGEEAVAGELSPFAEVADSEVVAACFRVQQRDEARHARFFDRVAREVMRVPGRTEAERRGRLRRELSSAFLELFEDRLPASAGGLATGGESLERAVALYHLLLEGVVFTAGQTALVELLDERGKLPGVRRGVELVLRDERWHIGFGTRLLAALRPEPAAVGAVVDDSANALRAWGEAIPPALRERALAVHRRRLAAAGLAEPASAAA